MVNVKRIKIGDHIGDSNEVLNIVGGAGKTGMGVVYICYHSRWDFIVALKSFQNRFLSSPEIIRSFKREALAWISLEKHPYIVNAISVDTFDERLFITMEYIPKDELGRNTLTHYLRYPISLKMALKWGIELCHAMEYAFSHGVSHHRDIKPDNIMITKEKTLKITDFGLAKLWDHTNFKLKNRNSPNKNLNNIKIFQSSKAGSIAGTPPWMAPEQFEGKSSVKSDIYSFGVVLYQMQNQGKYPFISSTIEGYEIEHKYTPLPNFNSKLFSIIKKCLRKKPKKRFSNFEEVRMELEGIYKKVIGESVPKIPDYLELHLNSQFWKGYSFQSLKMYDRAIDEYQKALEIDDFDIAVYINLGQVYTYKKKFDEAIGIINKGLTFSPKNISLLISLSDAYRYKGIILKDQALIDKSWRILERVYKANSEDLDTLSRVASYHINHSKDYNKATQCLEKYMSINPNISHPYHLFGLMYKRRGMVDEAIKWFSRAIKINPNLDSVYDNLGLLFFKKEMYDDATLMFQKALSIDSKNQDYHFNLSVAVNKRKIKRNDEILAGEFPSTLLELFERGDLEKALTFINRAITKNPHDSDLILNKGAILALLGKNKDALMYLNLALKNKPDFQLAIKIRELINQPFEKLNKKTLKIGNQNRTETETKRRVKELFQKALTDRAGGW